MPLERGVSVPGGGLPDPALRAAFLAARYGTAGSGAFLDRERGGGPAPDWAGRGWGVVTAWNPAGQPRGRAANEAAQRRLRAASRWAFREGVNGEGEWQEPSLILGGVRLRDVVALGVAFGQAAVLWGAGQRVALVWLPASGVEAARVERWWLRPATAPVTDAR
ncbi:DUF3293 domain-containing protein [Deinococcus depolymerans]|uniref:DUF3293 domain-containing protein n=1 Tax=Deinococcus depolymerans TaxID=392408 RepID=A0ABP3M2J3_9DEIO